MIADIACQVAAQQQDTEWRYTVTHPDTGLPVGVGTTRRRPTAAQRRQVETRDQVCVFPGCRMPATECDLDHRITWAQSRHTATDALAPGCRHDHHMRHHHAWTYVPLPGGDLCPVS